MPINVDNPTKVRIAKSGPNKLFGDYDKRQDMTDQQLSSIFDSTWKESLQFAVDSAEKVDSEEAKRRLDEHQRRYFDANQEHRAFRLQGMEVIAQIKPSKSQISLTQLWRVKSSDEYPKTLFVTFSSEEEREEFRRIATAAGWKDEDLGLQLVLDFMNIARR